MGKSRRPCTVPFTQHTLYNVSNFLQVQWGVLGPNLRQLHQGSAFYCPLGSYCNWWWSMGPAQSPKHLRGSGVPCLVSAGLEEPWACHGSDVVPANPCYLKPLHTYLRVSEYFHYPMQGEGEMLWAPKVDGAAELLSGLCWLSWPDNPGKGMPYGWVMAPGYSKVPRATQEHLHRTSMSTGLLEVEPGRKAGCTKCLVPLEKTVKQLKCVS